MEKPSRRIAALESHIIQHLGCHDCGAKAGQYCKPDYGCSIFSRIVPKS